MLYSAFTVKSEFLANKKFRKEYFATYVTESLLSVICNTVLIWDGKISPLWNYIWSLREIKVILVVIFCSFPHWGTVKILKAEKC